MEAPSMWQLIGETFRGPNRLYVWLVWIVGFAVFGVAVWSATRMCQVDEIKRVVLWATTFLASLIVIIGIKIWYWLELAKLELRKTLER